MKQDRIPFVSLTVLLTAAVARSQNQNPSTAPPPDARAQTQARANPQIEQQRKDAQTQAQNGIDQEAAAAIHETSAALKALQEGNGEQAMSEIERATGKINVLTARNPSLGLIPAAVDVRVIDAAPIDIRQIRQTAKAADAAVKDRDYPAARVFLAGLVSEIRIRTYYIPLASYPAALRDAARLLDQKKNDDAKAAIQTALNTLAFVDRVQPVPIVVAQKAIEEAQTYRDKDKNRAQQQLAVAREELDRAKELGYAGSDPEYPALASAIADIEKQLKGGQDSTSAFARLKDRVESFFRRLTSGEKRSEVARH